MKTHLHDRDASLVSRKLRWFVVATGCFTAFAGSLAVGIIFSIYPSVMVLGAFLQPRFPNLGRGLMLAGALLVSAWMLPYGVLVVFSDHTLRAPLVSAVALASVLLLAVCDVVLVIEEVRIRRAVASSTQN